MIHLPAHPNIPPLLDFARTSKAIHTVLALAPGEELFTYVNDKPEGRLDEDEARRIVAGILEALRHVHAAGILHRDIKLDNVFYDTATGTVSLIDFGLATFVDENTILEEAVGCINFASPALLRLTNTRHGFRPKGGHSDLWALGVLAHGLLTGYFPFRSEDPWEMQLEIAAGVHLDLEEVSDLGKDFLATVLDPANEGLISAKSLLRHPWIAPVAPRPSGQLPQTAPPKLPSPVIDGRRAAKAAESALQKVLPGYLASIAPRRKDETDSIASLEVAEQLVEVARSGSDTTLVSGISEISIAVPKVPAPVKRKTTLKDKFFSPATRLFDRLRAGQKK